MGHKLERAANMIIILTIINIHIRLRSSIIIITIVQTSKLATLKKLYIVQLDS